MKRKIRLLLALVLVAAVLMAFVPVTGYAEGIKTHFEGESCFIEQIYFGDLRLLGNSGRVSITGQLEKFYSDTNDPRTTGYLSTVNNMVVDQNFSGNVQGTFYLWNEDGSWSGHYTGVFDYGYAYIRATGLGSGDYEGLVGQWYQEAFVGYGPGYECFTISGYIVETGVGD
jgi:hypothetical protein